MPIRLLVAALLSIAAQEPARTPDPALRGLDPVALCEGREVPGRADLERTHGRYEYHFADEGSRARFDADPERWCIQWGGACARMGPLSGAGSPERWVVHGGHIYIFASDGCREGFLGATERFVPAPVAWPGGTVEAQEAGAAWIERAVQASGGAAAVDGQAGLRLGFEEEQGGWIQRGELLLARGGDVLRRSSWNKDEPGSEVSTTTWVLGAAPFVEDGEGAVALTSPQQLGDLRRHALREPLALLWGRGAVDFVALDLGPGELGGQPVENVLVRHGGLDTTLHLAAESGRVLGLSWTGRVTDGTTRAVVETISEWREVQGLELPVARQVLVDGKETPSAAQAWSRVELLAELPAGTFVGGAR